MSDNNWFENNETPPVGTECEVRVYDNNFIPCSIIFMGSETCVLTVNTLERPHYLVDLKFRPIQKKVVDITKFAGTDVWVVQKGNEKNRRKVGEFKPVFLPLYKPLIKEWNHITGLTEEPEWLEGFEYVVTYWHDHTLKYRVINEYTAINWPLVCAISITGLKDGWVYEN